LYYGTVSSIFAATVEAPLEVFEALVYLLEALVYLFEALVDAAQFAGTEREPPAGEAPGRRTSAQQRAST
jgi:hypothetical protein